MAVINNRRSLISSQARIQVPWVKVKIGKYIFGVRNSKESTNSRVNENGFYLWDDNLEHEIYYPNFVRSLTVTKINGQVNQYTLNIAYPVTTKDDPNFFEKVLSSVSKSRKIIFTYGDATQPAYVYKDEEAIITTVQQSFNFGSNGSLGAVINYTINAVSSAKLTDSGSYTFPKVTDQPSTIIKNLYKNEKYGLKNIFPNMDKDNLLDKLIASDDKPVEIRAFTNISVLEYIHQLVGYMLPIGAANANTSKEIYILTLHDDTIYDKIYGDTPLYDGLTGPYFKVTKISYVVEHSDAYELNIGFNDSTIVSNFSIEKNENYSILYDYQAELNPEKYIRKLNTDGKFEDVYAPSSTSNNNKYITRPEDITWWTKITKFPINASVTIQGLLRPAQLMQYIRINTIFPGGHKHMSSGLYIITKQVDNISEQGYKTTLNLTKISGDDALPVFETKKPDINNKLYKKGRKLLINY